MKSNFLKLNKPCSENWENMQPNEMGNFCKLCSKNVVDFTQKSQFEISQKIKEANGPICARLTQKQLNTPLLDVDTPKEYNIPFSNIAAGLMLATALTTGQALHAESTKVATEFVQYTNSVSNSKKDFLKSKSNNTKPNDVAILKGKINSDKNAEPIEHAQITFVTTQKILTTYTLEDGTFLLEIPTELIDNDNVIRVSYQAIKNKDNLDVPFGYETEDYVLSKKEINSEYQISAKPEVLYLGGISHYSEEMKPIVIKDGETIKYRDFIKAQKRKKNSCSLKSTDYYYFESKIAIAIYGKEAKHGLYILTDKATD